MALETIKRGLFCSKHRVYSRLRTRTGLGSDGRAMPRSTGPPSGQCVALFASEPFTCFKYHSTGGDQAYARFSGGVRMLGICMPEDHRVCVIDREKLVQSQRSGTVVTLRVHGSQCAQKCSHTTLQGYLGYKVTSARGSVGRRFLILRKPRAKPVGLRFLY